MNRKVTAAQISRECQKHQKTFVIRAMVMILKFLSHSNAFSTALILRDFLKTQNPRELDLASTSSGNWLPNIWNGSSLEQNSHSPPFLCQTASLQFAIRRVIAPEPHLPPKS